MRPPYLPPSFATHPFNGFLLLRCNLDVVDGCPLVPSRPHVSNFWGISAFSHRLIEHLDEPLLMLTDLLRGEEETRTLRRSCSSAFCCQTQQRGSRVVWLLPAAAEGSPCRAAAAELGAGQGSAGWPVSCAETGAEFARTPEDSHLTTHKRRWENVLKA